MDVGLVILDGWGLNPDAGVRDAVAAGETPTVDRISEVGAAGTLETHGRRVGLPGGQMGNSEVGHLTIGAGRTVLQESARLTDSIAAWRGERDAAAIPDPPLDENPAIAGAFDHALDRGGRLHLLGLVSDGGVHAYQRHLHALIDLAADRGVTAVSHAFTDGRDTSPTGGESYLAALEDHVDAAGTGEVATVVGRYYAMDRDEHWDRTRRAYGAIVNREAEHAADSAVAAVRASYARDVTDEFVEPTLIEAAATERLRPGIRDGDAAVFVNFRADRARQLTRMLADVDPVWAPPTDPPDVHLVTMTEYDEDFDLPVAFPSRTPADTLGEALAEADRTQLRIAETEKYAHVTYFLNGGRELEFAGEHREIVPSPDVATYDLRPEMSAAAVTDRAVAVIEGEDPDVLVVNYANPDMVGHTGDFEAAVAAVEAVDAQLDRLLEAIRAAGGHALVTADHGNADDMGTAAEPHTAHTTNPVPVVYLAPDGTDGGRTVREAGSLADVAPTVLDLAGVPVPAVMTGRSLFE
jgi:2,3-bisphosphoglycerate-independent phosphoglycerate mutase